MSSLLEQAIVDATALREAALKNAEAAIIEKYAPEIKSAVDTLLEQEAELGAPEEELGGDLGDLGAAEDPAAAEAQFTDEYREHFANPYIAAERGYVDDVVRPSETRGRLIRTLEMLEHKVQTLPRKKHGNLPL